MRRWIGITLAVALLAALALSGREDVRAANGDIVPGQFIVIVQPGVRPAAVAADHAAVPLHVYTVATRGFAAQLSPRQVAALEADPRVNNVVPDRYVRALDKPSGKPGGKPGGEGTSQVLPAGVTRIGADEVWSN